MEAYVEKNVYTEHCRMCDERFERDKHDIAKHGEDISDIKKLTTEISLLVKQNDELMKNHESRLSSLEHKPSMWLERIISAGISTFASALVAYLLAGGIL